MPGRPPYWQGFGVYVGERTVVAEMFCDEVVRYAAGTGRRLATLAPRDRKCAMESGLGHGLVAVLDDPETASTPDDHGTGWIPPSTDRVARELYDADTGDLRWRVPMSNAGASMDDVVSADPTVLVWTRLGQRMAQVFDADGHPGARLGLRLPTPRGSMRSVGVVDDVLVAQYTDGMNAFAFEGAPLAGVPTYAFDLGTGEERWHLAPEAGTVVGLLDDRVVLAQEVVVPGEDGAGTREVWLSDREVGASGDAQPRSLGSVDVGRDPVAVLGLAGDDLLVVGGNRLHAVPVPAVGDGETYDAPVTTSVAWADDDVRTEDAEGACRAVTVDTLAALGFQELDLSAPLDCRWQEIYRPDNLYRSLSVSVAVVQPGLSATGDELTAAESAQEQAETTVGMLAEDTEGDSTSTGWSVDEPVEGPSGELTWSAVGIEYGLRSTAVVRWRNVVIRVEAGQEVEVDDRRPAGVPESAVTQGVRDAVDDVLAALGADPVPAAPVVEPHGTAPDVCATLAEPVSELVRGRGHDQSPRIQAPAPESFCSWADGDVTASVRLFAADPLDGTSATEVAGELFDLTSVGRAMSGLGDRAVLRSQSRDYRYPSVLVQSGNALVEIGLYDVDGLSRAESDDRLTAMARTLLDALG